MLYDAYKKRMLKLHKVWLTVVKRRVPILLSLTAITVLLTAFLTCNGMIIADASLVSPTVKYGEKISVAAKSLFSEPDFEYRAADSDIWTSEEPVRAGDYFLRTVSKRTIGRQYGKEVAFTIIPRETEIVFDCDNIKYYGDSPEYTVELVKGDKVENMGFAYPENIEQTSENLWSADFTIDESRIVIVDGKGRNVTDCYTFSFGKESGRFGKKTVTVTTGDGEKTYDGEVARFCDSEAASLAYDDLCVIDDTAYTEFLHAGSFKNEIDLSSVKFENAKGDDVTEFYDYSVSFGTIEIKPLDITIKAGSDSKVYDGTELRCFKNEITGDNRLIDGYSYAVTFSEQSVITDAGKVANRIDRVRVTDVTGADYTSDYNFIKIDGELEITKRPITIETGSTRKTYDGEPVYAKDFTLINGTSAADGDNVIMEYSGYVNAGEYVNEPVGTKVYNAKGRNVTENYEIDFSYGKLTIVVRMVTYRTPTETFIYSGTAYSATDGDFESGSLAKGERCFAVDYPTVTFVTDKSVENAYTLRFENSKGEDTTDNYDVFYNNGLLSVVKREITVTTESGSVVYDGKPHTFENVKIADVNTDYGESNAKLSADHVFDFVFASVTFVTEGTKKNEVEVTVVLNGENVTENFDIGLICGDIGIDKRPMIIAPESNEKIYDGESSKWTNFEAKHFEPADGDIVTIPESAFTAFDDAGIYENIVDESKVSVTNNGEDRKANYDISVLSGQVTIKPRPIYLQTADLEKIYDGKPFEAINETVVVKAFEEFKELGITFGYEHDDKKEGVNDGLVKDHRATVVYENKNRPKYAGNYIGENRAEITALTDTYGNDVSKNYEIREPKFGNLVINKRPISIVTGSHDFEYDGDYHYWTVWDYADNSLEAVEGDKPIASSTPVRDVTEKPVLNYMELYFIDSDGRDMNVPFCYDVTISEYGKLTVYARKIKITIESDQKVYDGTPLICGKATADRLVSGHSIYPKDGEIPSITEVGSTDNLFDVTIACLQDGKNADVTSNYEITEIVKGTLTVTKRTVLLRTADESQEYCGEYLHGSVVYVTDDSPYGFAVGQTPVFDETQTYERFFKAGRYSNYFHVKIVNAEDHTIDYSSNYDIVYDYEHFGTFEVTKRKITVVNYDTTKVYDGYSVIVDHGIEYGTEFDHTKEKEGLVNGDEYEYSIAQTPFRAGTYPLSVYKIVKISAKDGSDFTDCYEISYAEANVVIQKRPITIQSGDAEKFYDGEPLTCFTANIVAGSLAETDTVAYGEFTSNAVEVGGYENKFIATFAHFSSVTGKHSDVVDDCYEVTYRYGMLTVLPNFIFVDTGSDEWTYDGISHRCEQFVLVDELPEGVTLNLISWRGTRARDVGTYPNELYFEVLRDGVVDDGYKVVIRNYGTLTVLSREVWIDTPDEAFEYDGGRHSGTPSDGMIRSESDPDKGIAPGQIPTVSANTSSYVLFVGDEAENLVRVAVTDDRGYDTTSNYTFRYNKTGTLSVTRRRIKFETMSYTKEYDGKEFDRSKMGCNILYSGEGDNKVALGNGDSPVVNSKTEGKILPGIYDNEAELQVVSNYYLENNGKPKDVTFCYEIEYVQGTLTITPRKLIIYAEGDRKLYDGTPLTCEKYTVGHYGDLEPGLINGEKMTVSFFVTKEMNRNSMNVAAIDPGVYYNQANILSIKDKDGNEVFEKNWGSDEHALYTIEESGYVCGVLEVLAKWRVSLVTEDAKKQYDGTPLTAHKGELLYLPDGYTYEIVFDEASTITDPGRVENRATVIIYDGNNNVVYSADNDPDQNRFDVENLFGTLVVIKRTLKIKTGSKQKAYDGEPLVFDDYTVSGLLDDHHVKLKVTGSITDPGFVDNTIDFYGVFDEAGNDVSDKYDLTVDMGTLKVNDGQGFDIDPLPSGKDDNGGGTTGGGTTGGDMPEMTPEFYITTDVQGKQFLKVLDFGAYDGKNNWTEATAYKTALSVSPDSFAARALYYGYTNVLSSFMVEYTDIAAISYKVMPTYFYEFAEDTLSNGFGGYAVYVQDELSSALLKNLTLNEYAWQESGYADYVYQEYSDVPYSTRNMLLGIVNSMSLSGYPTHSVEHKLEAIDAVSALFKSAYRLNGNFRSYPDNVDNVGYFLTQSKEGDRQQFASAGVLLLRMLNVPARYCVGYKTFTIAGEKHPVYKDEVYYWAEVYFDGIGWIKVDFEAGSDITPPDDLTKTLFYVTTDSENKVVYLKNKNYGDYKLKGWGDAPEYNAPADFSPEHLTTTALLNAGRLTNTLRVDYVDDVALPGKFEPTFFDKFLTEDENGYAAAFVSQTELWQMYDIGSLGHLGQLADYERDYADFVYDNYLFVPEETSAAISHIAATLGSKQSGRLTTAQKINMIMRIINLLKTYKYNLEFTGEDTWTDNVAGFLNSTEKEGVCRQFAASGTMLLRMFGIPARYCTGYAAETKPGQTVAVTGMDGHAWSEAYFDGIGWVQIEFTVGSVVGGGELPVPIEDDEDQITPDYPKQGWIIVDTSSVNLKKKYDGTPLTFDFDQDTMIVEIVKRNEGDQIKIVNVAQQVEFGKCACTIKIEVRDRNGKDVTDYYEVLYIGCGTLSVTN